MVGGDVVAAPQHEVIDRAMLRAVQRVGEADRLAAGCEPPRAWQAGLLTRGALAR